MTKKTQAWKQLDYVLKIWTFFRFTSQHDWEIYMTISWDNEQDTGSHISSKKYEESGYDLNLDLLTISYY